MGSTLGSYEIARSGLFVSERALGVTGHNIANANTPGYVRQQAVMAANRYETGFSRNGMYQIGLGADIQEIRQIRHAFLDSIYRQENTTLGYWESKNKALQSVQTILGEPMGEGLQSVLNQFWDSWQELSKTPDNLTARAMVRQRGEALAYHINHLGSQLDTLQRDLDAQIADNIDQVNQITSQIAKLNVEIFKNEAAGDKANDYRDQRNLLVDKLTKLMNVDVTEMQDGQLSIVIDGFYLVNRDQSTSIYAGQNSSTGTFAVPKFTGSNVDVPLKSGAIKGLMDARGYDFEATGAASGGNAVKTSDISISDLKKMLNDLIVNIVTEINTLHKSGYKLGSTSSTPDGEDFFTVINSTRSLGLGNIKINDNLSNPNNIVASASNASGDNTLALKIANLRNDLVMNDSTGKISIDSYYQAIIQGIGNSGSEAQNVAESQSNLVLAADASRQAIAGVSMDEEMTNMMKYQFAYGAASRVINVIDEMIETVATRLGIVGR